MLLNILVETGQELDKWQTKGYEKIVEKFNEWNLKIGVYNKTQCACCCDLDKIELYPENKNGVRLTHSGKFSNYDFPPTLTASELDSISYLNSFLEQVELAVSRNKTFEKMVELGFIGKTLKTIFVEKTVREIHIELDERKLLRIIETSNLNETLDKLENETEFFETVLSKLDIDREFNYGFGKLIKKKTDKSVLLKEKLE